MTTPPSESRASESRPAWQKLAALAAVLVAAVLVFRAVRGNASANGESGPAPSANVPAPANFLADVVFATPNGTWQKLQRAVGGAAGILPTTLPGVLVALTDLDARLSAELDGAAPMYGVVTGDPNDLHFALATRLVDGRRARTTLLEGEAAPYTATPGPAGLTLLVPKRGTAESELAAALSSGGFFVVARSVDDLGRLAPYITGALPARPAASSSVVVEMPREALSGAVHAFLERSWKDAKAYLLAQDQRMRAERGRPPDFGDPAAIVGALDGVVGRRIAIASDFDKARITLDVTDESVAVVAMMTPTTTPTTEKAEGAHPARAWLDHMRVGEPSVALSLPASSFAALAIRDDAEARANEGEDLEKAVASALGARLGDPTKLREATKALAAARGESFALALVFDEAGPAAFVKTTLADGDADGARAKSALRGILDLPGTPPFKELFGIRDLKASTTDLPGLGAVDTVVVTPEPSPSRGPRRREADVDADAGGPASVRSEHVPVDHRPIQVAYAVRAEPPPRVLLAALGPGAPNALRSGASPSSTLADEPTLRRFVAGIGNDASSVVVLQPLRLGQPNAPPAPIGLAIGKRAGDAFVRIDIPSPILREAVRWQTGF